MLNKVHAGLAATTGPEDMRLGYFDLNLLFKEFLHQSLTIRIYI